MFTKKQILVLVVCCLMIASSVGLLTNTSGIFFTPIASELGVGKGAVSMTITEYILCVWWLINSEINSRKKFQKKSFVVFWYICVMHWIIVDL